MEKQYWAIVHGHVADSEGVIDAPLGKDEASEVVVKDCVRPDGQPSRTRFWTQWRFERAEGKFQLAACGAGDWPQAPNSAFTCSTSGI